MSRCPRRRSMQVSLSSAGRTDTRAARAREAVRRETLRREQCVRERDPRGRPPAHLCGRRCPATLAATGTNAGTEWPWIGVGPPRSRASQRDARARVMTDSLETLTCSCVKRSNGDVVARFLKNRSRVRGAGALKLVIFLGGDENRRSSELRLVELEERKARQLRAADFDQSLGRARGCRRRTKQRKACWGSCSCERWSGPFHNLNLETC